jgi:hypothetical protein
MHIPKSSFLMFDRSSIQFIGIPGVNYPILNSKLVLFSFI